MREYILDTDGLAARQQLDFWVDAVCRAYTGMTVQKIARNSRGFAARMTVRELGNISLSTARAERSCVHRTRADISSASEDIFLFYLQHFGQSQLLQAGQEIHLRQGDMALCDGSRPSQLNLLPYCSQQHEMIVVKIPTPYLIALAPNAHALAGIKMTGSHGVGAILSTLIVNAWQHQKELTDGAIQSRMADQLLNFIALSLNEYMPKKLPASSIKAGHLLQIKQFISQHLTDPELSIAMISAANRVTPRYLHKLFESEPWSVSQFILHQRLDACERALRSAQYAHFSVTMIAHMWGFKDAAHFGHAFKKRFMLSPGEYRKQFQL